MLPAISDHRHQLQFQLSSTHRLSASCTPAAILLLRAHLVSTTERWTGPAVARQPIAEPKHSGRFSRKTRRSGRPTPTFLFQDEPLSQIGNASGLVRWLFLHMRCRSENVTCELALRCGVETTAGPLPGGSALRLYQLGGKFGRQVDANAAKWRVSACLGLQQIRRRSLLFLNDCRRPLKATRGKGASAERAQDEGRR